MEVTFKEVIGSSNWIITNVLIDGRDVRIDARRRFPVNGAENFFSRWSRLSYINRLRHSVGLPCIQSC